ncbi:MULTISPECIES: hypothetical protein [unclassified Pseudomonas]|uniref:hypothetical protein n=1 Tax=unclassified Pseudomonas TaxID=196821 RepID=UPI0020975D7C|nr:MULTISPECIES: hypothetical protein [unclassified Pseudomonas]MCO7519452.1 hypothetical protein [Pseudomonas sp. 1]MCO7541858.1 hypothetical protein [Pseudomonas sp. VA159-2]
MDYPKRIPNVGLVGGKFVDENVSTGLPGSLIPSAWGNAVTDELLAVIRAAGIAPSEDNNAQLLQAIQGLAASDVKRAVRVATTGPIALSGLQTLDGVALVAGDRVLVKDQANAAQNWIYTASAAAWSRALDANDDAECAPGHLIIVQAGTVYAGTMWQLTNTEPPQVGATPLNFRLLFGKTGVVAGDYRQVSVDVLGRVTSGKNPTTLGGYGIADAYTKTEVDSLTKDKVNSQDVYSKQYLDSELSKKAGKATTLAGYGITDALRSGFTDQHPIFYSKTPGPNWEPSVFEVREVGLIANGSRDWSYAPRLAFHWANVAVGHLGMDADGVLKWNGSKVYTEANFNAAPLSQATESNQGTARIATIDQVIGGGDDSVTVTPRKLRWGFSVSLAQNGYIAFPSWLGGLIIQWAYSEESGSINDYRYFPIAYPHTPIAAFIQLAPQTTGGYGGNHGTILGVVDNSRYVWSAGGGFGGGGFGWVLSIGW